MYFRAAKDGKHILFAHIKSSLKDMRKAVVLHKNKQYQWLLAEAYEDFKDFIENSYAFAGHIDKNLWPLNDFGRISLTELKEKDFEWFRKRARIKRDVPQSIINRFRDIFPDISRLETENKLGINLRLAVALIESLRHIIVHKSGIVSDKQKFIEDVLKKSGLYNNGKYKDEHKVFIKSFFGARNYKNVVVLLEAGIKPEIPFYIHVNLFEVLSRYLMAYANIILECLQAHKKNEISYNAV